MSRVTPALRGLCAVAALTALLAAPTRSAAQSPIGVWRLTHVKNSTREGDQVQPAYTAYFANGYFVVMFETSDGPRPNLPDNPTPAQQLAAWGPFTAQFGTYQVNGSDITYTELVAKNPAGMRPGSNTYTRSFKISGNTLTTTGPAGINTYMRVE